MDDRGFPVSWWGAGVTPRAPLGGTVGGECK